MYSESEKTNNALGNIRQTLVDDCNNPKSLMGFIDRSTLNTPYSEGITSAVNGLLFSVSPNQAIWNGQMILGNSQNLDIFFRGSNGVGSGFSKWGILAKKSDLTDIIVEKGFHKSVDIPAGNAYSSMECDIEYTTPSGYRALDIYKGLVINSTCCVYNSYLTNGKARLVISNLNGSQKTVTAYAFILFIKA